MEMRAGAITHTIFAVVALQQLMAAAAAAARVPQAQTELMFRLT
jgi:hypothetical protein